MAFVKLVKNKAYFKRFQVKYRRRREGKTDFQARRRLVTQDKNKYSSPKYRFVCRLTNKRIICQIVCSCIVGDKVICSADSKELVRYGIRVGLTNYPAAYSTGLLLGRRLLQQLGMDKLESMSGVGTADGEEYHVEEHIGDEQRKAFKCLLDVGIVRTTTGNRVFGAMKGACDAGLHIPHSTKCFPGYSKDEGDSEGKYDPSVHRDRIYGAHIATYMKSMLDESPEKYEHHFSQFVKASIKADDLKDIYTKAHINIRKDPSRYPGGGSKPPRQHAPVCIRDKHTVKTSKTTFTRHKKLTPEERKARVAKKMDIIRERLSAS